MSTGSGKTPDVVIAGGGLAGIACALRLAEAGASVRVVETRKRLGGRATSFVDPRTGETVDNCQHVALGCCTSYLDLLDRLGAGGMLRWDREQHWLEPGGRVSRLRPSVLPAPGHHSLGLLGASFLSAGAKAQVSIGMTRLMRTEPSTVAGLTFGDLLTRWRQGDMARRRFWEPVVVSACNMPCDRVAAGPALQVFQQGFLASARAAEIGVATVPLVRLYDGAVEAIRAVGGEVELGASVTRLDEDGVELGDGRRLDAGRVVCALPFERAVRVVDVPGDARFVALSDAEHSPIVGVHLVFDRPVLAYPHAVLVDRGTHWLFRKDDEGRRVHAVISAADEWVGLDESEIVGRVVGDIAACVPESAAAKVEHARSVKEKRATFACTPAFERVRPAATHPDSRLVLAGDYTATGWPATMEGATRSGYVAAAAVLGVEAGSMLAAELPPAGLSGLLVRGLAD